MSITQSIKKIYTEQDDENFIPKRDCLVTIIWHNIIGIPIIRLMQKLQLKFHPNLITIFSLPFGLLAGYFFFINQLLYGAIFFAINMLIDSFDGKWARLTKQTSELGAKLDFHIDRIAKGSMYFGIWYSQFYLIGQWLLGTFFIGIHFVGEVFRVLFIKDTRYKTIIPHVYSYYSQFEEAYLTFFFAPLFGIVQILLPIAIILTWISYMILFIKQKERPDTKPDIKKILKL